VIAIGKAAGVGSVDVGDIIGQIKNAASGEVA
jgi:hypothetical protein